MSDSLIKPAVKDITLERIQKIFPDVKHIGLHKVVSHDGTYYVSTASISARMVVGLKYIGCKIIGVEPAPRLGEHDAFELEIAVSDETRVKLQHIFPNREIMQDSAQYTILDVENITADQVLQIDSIGCSIFRCVPMAGLINLTVIRVSKYEGPICVAE